jgi:hypothetical protein
LARAPLNLGFDWRLVEAEGVAATWRPSELIFTFSGSEPEACVVLEQTLYFAPRHFRLRFDYLTGLEAPSGVRWALDNTAGPPLGASESWSDGAFDIPHTRGLAHLRLVYQRQPGTTRTQGRIEFRNLRLENIP